MRTLLVLILIIFAINVLPSEAALPTAEELDNVVPKLSQVVQTIYDHQPFQREVARRMLLDHARSQLESLKGPEQHDLRTATEAAIDNARFPQAFESLKARGITTIRYNILMSDSTNQFVNQLGKRLSKHWPEKKTHPLSKGWFHSALTNYLLDEPEANYLDLRSKVFGAIEKYYPDSRYFSRDFMQHYYVDRKAGAMRDATRIFDTYAKYGDMPMDGWWKKSLNRLAHWYKAPKASSTDPQISGSNSRLSQESEDKFPRGVP